MRCGVSWVGWVCECEAAVVSARDGLLDGVLLCYAAMGAWKAWEDGEKQEGLDLEERRGEKIQDVGHGCYQLGIEQEWRSCWYLCCSTSQLVPDGTGIGLDRKGKK